MKNIIMFLEPVVFQIREVVRSIPARRARVKTQPAVKADTKRQHRSQAISERSVSRPDHRTRNPQNNRR